jgi:hypothetical protein
MADIGMPDVITPEQMKKLGGAGHPDELPDTLTPDQMDRASEKPKSYPPTEDERLGIDTPLAKPSGYVWDSHAKEFRKADQLGTAKTLPPGFVPERGLIREDPAMDVATTIAGAGAGKVAGGLMGKLSPHIAKIIEPAVAGATTSALQGGDRGTNAKAALIGAAFGVPGAALSLVRGAPAAVAERLPTQITGGLKTKAAKKVVAGGLTDDVLEAHPQLKKVLATAPDVGTKFNATSSTLGKLTNANDAVYDAIQAQHQGVPLEPIAKHIQAVAERAHAEGNEVLEDAAQSAIENLQRYGDVTDKRGMVATATQVRGVRNNLARRVQAMSPTLTPTDAQAAADEIRRAISDGIEDIAGKTKGVDVAGLRERNRQIAALMPLQRSLREQALNEKLLPPHDLLSDFIEHPSKKIAGLVREIPAHGDVFLSKPGFQRFANGARSPLPDLAHSSLLGGAAAAGARKGTPRPDDLEYAGRVSSAMANGKSLQEAIDEAEAR